MKITTLRPENFRKMLTAAFLCVMIPWTGCGRSGNASTRLGDLKALPAAEPPELPMDQQTEQKLDPLTRSDVDLYLKVMRAAAGRVNNPLPGDTATLDAARKILAARAVDRIPTQQEVTTLQRANLVALSMDQIVAEEMKLDGRTYRGIAEAVEAVVPNPDLDVAPADTGSPAADRGLTPLERRLDDVNAANKLFLAPYRGEIQKLIAVVRNPASLPK